MLDILHSICTVGVILTVISTILLNATVISAYCKMIADLRRNITNTLLLNQSVADLTVVVCSILWLAGQAHYRTFFLFSSCIAIMSLLTTTLDTALSVKLPLRHQRLVGGTKVKVVVLLLLWTISAIPAIIYRSMYADSLENFTFAKAVFAVLLALVVLIVMLLYHNYRTLKSYINERIDNMASLPLSERNEDELNEERGKKRQLLACLVLMVTGYGFSILPHIVLVLVDLHGGGGDGEWQNLTYLVYTLSSTINPLLTIFLRKDFRRAKNWIKLKGFYSRPKQQDIVEQDVTIVDAEL